MNKKSERWRRKGELNYYFSFKREYRVVSAESHTQAILSCFQFAEKKFNNSKYFDIQIRSRNLGEKEKEKKFMSVHTITLSGGGPWGIRIQGGKDFNSPLSIRYIKINSR